MIPINIFKRRPKPSNAMDLDTTVSMGGHTDPMSTTPDSADPSIKILKGTIVGLFDDSQKDRVLSTPDSVLSFATFNPWTASGRRNVDGSQRFSPRAELDNAKRVVIETLATGEIFWRWVPRARGVDSVKEEGEWPRVVLVCGQRVHMSQSQWEIYKLDPFYDCYIPPNTGLPIISPNKGKEKASPGPTSDSSQSSSSSSTFAKRSFSASDTDPEPVHRTNKQPRYAYVDSDEDDEDEVVEIVEEEPVAGPSLSFKERVKQRRAGVEQDRRARREKLASRNPRYSTDGIEDGLIDLTMDDATNTPSAASTSKHVMDDDDDPMPPKRTKVRRRSPSSIQGELAKKRESRKKERTEAYTRRKVATKEEREKAFLEELIVASNFGQGESSQEQPYANYDPPSSQHTDDIPPTTRDDDDPVPLEEKIRRMREMNEWEAAAEAAQRRKAQEAVARVRAEAKEQERRKAEEARKKKEEEEARLKSLKEKRRMQREHPSWAYGPWSDRRALECYRKVSEFFDSAKFSAEEPITFEDIPWPVLFKPGTYGPQDVEWSAVEKFFSIIRPHMRTQDYKDFVQVSHRRFHPDRWRARRVWDGMQDEELRAALEVAANTVAQALTPIWREAREQ